MKLSNRTLSTISERRRKRFESVIRMRQSNLTIVIENIWDPHNVSAILRTADAVGIRTVHLLYYIEKAPNFSKVGKQSSASAKKWLEFVPHPNVTECSRHLHERNFKILASRVTPSAPSLYQIDATENIAFVFGNEHRGVSEEMCSAADGIYYIPMLGMVQSLNASVAAAVTMYEACRQRIAVGSYEHSLLRETEIELMLQDWARR